MTANCDSTRVCSKCGVEKNTDNFPKRQGVVVGKVCSECVNLRQNLRRAKALGIEDKHALAVRNAAFKLSGLRECKDCGRVLAFDRFLKKKGSISTACLDCKNAKIRQAYAENAGGLKDRLIAHGKERRKKFGALLNEQKKQYVAANRAKVTDRQNAWAKSKLKSDPLFAVKKRIRSLISNAFASIGCRKNADTQRILGCTFEEFQQHLERQFTDGMSWEKMGVEIHMDHIIPLATAKTEQDVIALNHFSNLRPLWAEENIKKGAKLLQTL